MSPIRNFYRKIGMKRQVMAFGAFKQQTDKNKQQLQILRKGNIGINMFLL